MKKRIYMTSTKWRYFLTELPLLLVLAIALYYNGRMTTVVRLYPMIVVFCGLILFDFLYFFRLVRFSYEDVRTVGRYSSRDKVLLVKDKTLVLTVLPHHKLRVEVIGCDEGTPTLAFIKDEDAQPFCQLRCKAVGGKASVLRLLSFYKIEGIDTAALFAQPPYSLATPMGTLTASTVNERREIRLTFAVSFDTDGTVIEDDEPTER